MGEDSADFAHDDKGNLIASLCLACGTVTAAGHAHECATPPKWATP